MRITVVRGRKGDLVGEPFCLIDRGEQERVREGEEWEVEVVKTVRDRRGKEVPIVRPVERVIEVRDGRLCCGERDVTEEARIEEKEVVERSWAWNGGAVVIVRKIAKIDGKEFKLKSETKAYYPTSRAEDRTIPEEVRKVLEEDLRDWGDIRRPENEEKLLEKAKERMKELRERWENYGEILSKELEGLIREKEEEIRKINEEIGEIEKELEGIELEEVESYNTTYYVVKKNGEVIEESKAVITGYKKVLVNNSGDVNAPIGAKNEYRSWFEEVPVVEGGPGPLYCRYRTLLKKVEKPRKFREIARRHVEEYRQAYGRAIKIWEEVKDDLKDFFRIYVLGGYPVLRYLVIAPYLENPIVCKWEIIHNRPKGLSPEDYFFGDYPPAPAIADLIEGNEDGDTDEALFALLVSRFGKVS